MTPSNVSTEALSNEFQPEPNWTLDDIHTHRLARPLIEGSELPDWRKYFDGIWDRWYRHRDPAVEVTTAKPGTLDAYLIADNRTVDEVAKDEWDYIKAVCTVNRYLNVTRGRQHKSADGPNFAKPRVVGRVHDSGVLLPKSSRYDHWFPRGRVHAIAGASGSGKSTFMLDMLRRQANGETVLGHRGAGYTYAVAFYDRGQYDNEETMERLGLDPHDPHLHYLNDHKLDAEAAEAIKQYMESQPEMPEVLFIEGADMLISKPADMQPVTQFLRVLGAFAEHYFISIILSVGSGKVKGGEKGYQVQRESIYGTVAWGRKLSGVICLNYENDETNKDRKLTYSNRNARAEQFDMTFNTNGLLVEKTKRPEDVPPLDYWFMCQPENAFTAAEALEGLRETGVSVSQPTVYRQLQALLRTGMIAQRRRELPNGKWVWEYRWSRQAPVTVN
jgi:hypothetical protein